MQPSAEEIKGFKRVNIAEPYALSTKNKIAMILDCTCEFQVFTVLLVRKRTVVAAQRNEKGVTISKIEIPITVGPADHTWVYEPEQSEVVEVKPARVKVALEGGITKIQRCRELYAANIQLDKPAMIDLFVREAGCTPMGANTYYITCRKATA